MKRWIGAVAFVLALSFCVFGLTGLPQIAQAHGVPTLHIVVVYASPAPPTGTAPVGLPNGSPAVSHSTTIYWNEGAMPAGVTLAGFDIYTATTSGGEAGTPAVNGATPIPTTSTTNTCPAGATAPCFTYSVPAVDVVAGATRYFVADAMATTGQQSGFSNEATAATPANAPNPPNPSGCGSTAN